MMMKTFILALSTIALASCTFSGAYRSASQQFDFSTSIIGKDSKNVYAIPVEEYKK
jgi:hypothetical protein